MGIHAGLSLPVAGYKGVFKNGWLVGAGGKYRLGNGNFALGMKTSIVRLQRDRNSSDAFQNARMTIAPLLFTAEYKIKMGALRPYIGTGLGVSLFSLSHDVSPTEGRSDVNVSFTMAPSVGLRYKSSDHLYPFIETNTVLLADGPPIGFPKANRMTGYHGIQGGLSYRF